jgi:D-alanyl-D-alanine carboxypeptidase
VRSRTILAAVLLLIFAIGTVALPRPEAPAARGLAASGELQATLEDALRESGAPGASAAVVDDGGLVWSGVAGTRTLRGEPVAPSTRFVTASAGKTVTAAMIFRLADQGRVSLGDRLSEHVNGLHGARRVRIRHLLEHSSGLPDYFSNPEIWRTIQREPAHEWTRAEVFDAVGRLRFRPGSRVSYSNTNYIALGGVIESVTGGSVEEEFHRSLVAPLGLLDSSWRYDPKLYDAGAHPYLQTRNGDLAPGWDDGFVSTDYVGEVWTDGGLATTGADFARFANALVAGELLSPPSRRALLRFREQGYGRGIFRIRFDGRSVVGHDGLYDGFTAQHWTDPASGITVAVLVNAQSRGGDPSWSIWKRLARVIL